MRRELFSGFLHSEFLGGMNRHVSTPLIAALSPGHSDITRFRPWSSVAPGKKSFGSRRTEKILKLLRLLAPLKFLIRVQAFRDLLRGELTHVSSKHGGLGSAQRVKVNDFPPPPRPN